MCSLGAEIVDRVRNWIVGKGRTTQERLAIAEKIHDLCKDWIKALSSDLESERDDSGLR